MKNLNEEIERINQLSNYEVGVVINEQVELEGLPAVLNKEVKNLYSGNRAVLTMLVPMAVGLLGTNILSMIKNKQMNKLRKLISHFKVVIDKIDDDEINCLETKNVPIKLLNTKSIVNKEREIRVWLSGCIKDVDKLNEALSQITNIIKSYREEKDEKGFYTN